MILQPDTENEPAHTSNLHILFNCTYATLTHTTPKHIGSTLHLCTHNNSYTYNQVVPKIK